MKVNNLHSVKDLLKFCIDKDILKNKKNQHCNANKERKVSECLPNRVRRRNKNYKMLEQQGINPWELYTYLDKKRTQGKGLIYKLVSYLLFLSSRGIACHASIKWLASYLGCHTHSIPRLTKELAEFGLIRKCYRGMKKSVLLVLNKIFNNPTIKEVISPLFIFMYMGPIAFLIPNITHAMVRLGSVTRSSISKHVNYNKECLNINNYSTKKSDILSLKEERSSSFQPTSFVFSNISPDLIPKRGKNEENVVYTTTERVDMNAIGAHYQELEDLHKLNMTSFGKFKLTVLPKHIVIKLYGSLLGQSNFPSYERFFNRARIESERQKINIEKRLEEFEQLCKEMHLDPQSPVVPKKELSEEYLAYETYLASPEGQRAQAALGPLKNPFAPKD